jgi:serine/threonine-protein kinase
MQHAYLQGIVHRDIKPSNFLVTRKNDRLVVKMTDLGLSREAKPEETRVTKDGTTVGTIDYMAPEQARDSSRADTRSDIYSLGCTLYHMLAGQPPFSKGGLTERLYAHIQDEPPDIQQFNPHVSEGLMAVLRRMLAKQPADRYQTPAELVKELIDVEVVARPASNRDVLAGLAFGEVEVAEKDVFDRDAGRPRRHKPAKSRPVTGPRSGDDARDAVAEAKTEPPVHGLPPWLVAAAAGAVVLLVVLIGLVVLRRSGVLSQGTQPTLLRSIVKPYNKPRTHDDAPGTLHALRIAGNAPRRPGDGLRSGSHGAA